MKMVIFIPHIRHIKKWALLKSTFQGFYIFCTNPESLDIDGFKTEMMNVGYTNDTILNLSLSNLNVENN